MPAKVKEGFQLKQLPLVLFSFYQMPKKGKYSFEYFGHDFRRQNKAYQELLNKLAMLTSLTMPELMRLDKATGFEMLSLSEFALPIQHHLLSFGNTQENKLAVFRFNQQNNRMICLTEGNVFSIVAFDFDFTAYDHG